MKKRMSVHNKYFLRFRSITIFRVISVALIFVHVPICFAQEEPVGKAISLVGKVSVLGNPERKTLLTGSPFFVGDVVETGEKSNIRILLSDQTILDIQENSKFIIKQLSKDVESRQGDFELDFGRLRASINKKLDKSGKIRVKTKASVFSVRGTDFNVESSREESLSSLTVFEGKVLSESEGNTQLVDDQSLLLVRQEGTELKKLSKNEIETIFAKSRVEDLNYFQNIVVGDPNISRNFGNATISSLNQFARPPNISIPKDAFKIPGINQLNATAVSPGVLNILTQTIGVKIQ